MLHPPMKSFHGSAITLPLYQLNRDVDKDGTVDIALMSTFSGGVAGAGGYEVEFQDSAGQTYSIRSDTGSAWLKANTQRSYRARWRTINWVNIPGPWSSYTSYVTPSPTIGAPASPSGISVSAWYLGVSVIWTAPSELDYSHTNVRMGSASSQYSSGGMTVNSNSCVLFYPQTVFPEYVWVQHVNTSGLASAWVRSGSSVTPDPVIDDHLAAGAAGATATSNLGTSLGGSVNAGPGSSTLLILEWKCTSNTAGVSVTLGSKTQTFDFKDQQPFTMISRESGGGSFSSSKSGGGTLSGAELVAITLN